MEDLSEVVLFSGGIDSLYTSLIKPNARLIYITAGFSHQTKDLYSLSNFSHITGKEILYEDSLNLQKFERPDFGMIFCRNLLFATIACNYGDIVYLGGIRGDNVPDKTPSAFRIISSVLTRLGGKKVVIKSELWRLTKSDIIKRILHFPKGKELLLNSVSCYSNTSRHCGECGSCFRRWVGMVNNNIVEEYNHNPWKWSKVDYYISEMKKGNYDKRRTKETFFALKKYGVLV